MSGQTGLSLKTFTAEYNIVPSNAGNMEVQAVCGDVLHLALHLAVVLIDPSDGEIIQGETAFLSCPAGDSSCTAFTGERWGWEATRTIPCCPAGTATRMAKLAAKRSQLSSPATGTSRGLSPWAVAVSAAAVVAVATVLFVVVHRKRRLAALPTTEPPVTAQA